MARHWGNFPDRQVFDLRLVLNSVLDNTCVGVPDVQVHGWNVNTGLCFWDSWA